LTRIGLGTLLALAIVMAVPPLRRAALRGTSQAIFLAASPFAPDVSDFNQTGEGTKIVAADGTVLVQLAGTERRSPVALASLPPHVRNAVLAAEDANFYHHPGVDASALLRAAINNVRGGPEQGGSTITQQLAKITYTDRKRSLFRKVKEVLYASQLERHYTKDQLLERYINEVYFGEGSYGIGAASKEFFGITPDKLTPAQAAFLAGKIRAPEGLNPRKDLPAVQRRRDEVLRNMARHHWLSAADLNSALAEPITLSPPSSDSGLSGGTKAPYFVELVRREAATLTAFGDSPEAALFNGGYTIETTLDVKALDATTDAVRKQLNAPGDPSAAVVSVQPGDGAIRNLFGGLDFQHNQFDVASQGTRQPGSSFKPFVYIAALRNGVDPRTTYDSKSPLDLPCNGQPVHVRNYEGTGHGPITVDDAMIHSVNVVFTQLICQIGPDKVVQVAKDMRFQEPINADPAIALGGLTKGVSPLEMAAAYATFAAKGVYAQPYAIARIRDRTGKVVYTHTKATAQVIEPQQAGVLTAALQRVVQQGTGTAAAIGRPVAGKTGTTENFGNAWFIGYVPQLATAVWVGHIEGDIPMTSVHGAAVPGGRFPASIFAATMRAALAGQRTQSLFTAPPDVLGLRPPPPKQPADTAPKPSTTTTATVAPTTSTSVDTGSVDTTPTTAPPDNATTSTTPVRPTTSTPTTAANQRAATSSTTTTTARAPTTTAPVPTTAASTTSTSR
jgi:penicillin-binding protein 1A